MAENLSSGKTSVSTEKTERLLIIERVFDAPRELVFKAFTEPERVAQWWGPRGWETTNYGMDVKPGGVWHYCMRGPDGVESWGKAVYREVAPPERFVYVDTFSDADGNGVPGMPEMLIRTEFTDLGGGKTKVTSRSQFASAEALQSILDMGAVGGITETWDRLEEYLASA